MGLVVVWYNPNKNIYYFKKVSGFYSNYKIGYTNSYGHSVILVIDNVYFIKDKRSLKKRLITKMIRFLENLK